MAEHDGKRLAGKVAIVTGAGSRGEGIGIPLPAVIKGAVVFGCTLFLSWWAVAALRRLPSVCQIIGAERGRGAVTS